MYTPKKQKSQSKVIFLKILLLVPLGISTTVFSQNNRMGGSVVYNLHTKGLGLGIRGEIPINRISLLNGISIVPQLTYFPSYNPIHEFYLGSGVHLGVYSIERWSFYALTNISYNGWINNDDAEYREGKFSNLGIEAGLGVSRKVKKCLHPFFEFRYNFRWNEITMGLGLMYTLKCERRGAVPCSKIPPQPQF